MSIRDELLAVTQTQARRQAEARIPKAWRAGERRNQDGTADVTSQPYEDGQEVEERQLLTDHGYDPDRYVIVGGWRTSSWTAYKPREYRRNTEGGDADDDLEAFTFTARAYKFKVAPRPAGQTANDIADLVAQIRAPDRPRATRAKTTWADDGAFVHGFGDLQIGKMENPLEELVPRFQENVAQGLNIYLSRKPRQEHVHLPFLGDCIEGNQSQGGRNMWRTTLTMTEQVRVLRRLMLAAIQAYAPHCKRLTVVSVPGNHDEASSRNLPTRMDDSWATETLVSVSEALTMSKEYAHVECYTPGVDEGHVTLNVGGAWVTHIHGHQISSRGKHFEWWKDQHWHDQDSGLSTVMFRGHEHTGQYEEQGKFTALAWPALETRSIWFEHKRGIKGRPGTFALDISNGHIDGLHRIK